MYQDLTAPIRIDPSLLSCPFRGEPNQYAAAVQRQSAEWLALVGVALEPTLEALLLEVGWLCALVYPAASRELLTLAADWTSLFLLLDDQARHVASRDATAERNITLVGVLAGRVPPRGDSLLRALHDVGRRAERLGGAVWMAHFLEQVRRWLDAHLWQFDNRQAGRVPALERYLINRPYAAGIYSHFLLSELTDDYRLTELQRQDPVLQRLAQLANNQIAWSQDIVALAEADVHNLVLSLMESRSLELTQALGTAVDMHNREVAAFLELELALQRSCPSSVQRYLGALRNWMGGHLRWAVKRHADREVASQD